MDRIGYQIWDTIEEIWEEEANKKEEQQKKVQDQLKILQRILETTCITQENRSGGGPSTRPRTAAQTVQPTLT
jgi:hypothetical protein